jgi:hypothetical protein
MMSSHVLCHGLESCTGSCMRMSRAQTSLSATIGGSCLSTQHHRAYRSSSHMARSRLIRYPLGSDLASCSIKSLEPDRCYSVTGQGTSDTRRTSLKEWTQYLTKFSAAIDVGAVSRVLTSLNVDLPKQFTELKRMLPSVSFGQQQNQQNSTQITEQMQNLEREKQTDSSKTSRPGDTSDTTREKAHSFMKTLPKAAYYADREQHDFGSAMSNVQECITSFSKVSSGNSSPSSKADSEKYDSKIQTVSPAELVKPTTSAEAQGSMLSTLNAVYSGISRQIAGYMPSVSVEKVTQPTTAVPVPVTQPATQVSKPPVEKQTKSVIFQRKLVARGSIDRQTRGLVMCLRDARTSTSQLVRLEELSRHIMMYPDCIGVAVKVVSDNYTIHE